MKIIEAMKQIKDLQRKADDLVTKVTQYGVDMDIEAPTYGTVEQQRQQVGEWVQAHRDIVKEILRLRVAIQRTNLATQVAIELEGKPVTKSIAEWIHRRRDLATLEQTVYNRVMQRAAGMRAGTVRASSGEEKVAQVRRYFDQGAYDERVAALRSEPLIIDGTLEVVNAVTDLVEA